ncbi:reverse transcriptase domain-containing protein [Tanacetum coccineum]
MRTRSSSNVIVESSTIPKRRNRRRSKQIVELELQTIVETPVATMADTLGLLQLVTSSQFHNFERDDPHAHIRWFNKITSTLKYKNVPHDAIKLMLFPFSLEGAARIWLEKEPPRSIHTWEDLRFDETFSEAWDRFKDLLRKCPHHGFSELHQIDTFYNALTQSDQDSLNAAAGGNILNRTPRDALTIIENKSKRQSPSGSGSLPTDTVANPRGDVKAITTRSGVAYEGPSIPPTSSSLPKEVEREPEVTRDKLDECLALADLGASINRMPLSVWKKLLLPELSPSRMTLELANRSVAYPIGVAEDVFVKVGKTARALIDVHSEELTLRVNDEAITFKVGHTSRYSRNYYNESANQINVIDVACEEYAQEVLGFLDSSTSGNPTPSDPIIASFSPSFTPFEGGDFILEEIETFLNTLDNPSNLDDDYYDTEGDILYLEKLLNEDPFPNLSPMKNEELKQVDVTTTKPSIEEPP